MTLIRKPTEELPLPRKTCRCGTPPRRILRAVGAASTPTGMMTAEEHCVLLAELKVTNQCYEVKMHVAQ